MIDRLASLFEELKERRAIRFLIGYLVGAWITAQVAGFFVEQGYVGRRVLDVTLFLAVVCFFLAIVLVWYHGEKGQQKIQRVEALAIGVLLIVGAGGSAWVANRGAGQRAGGNQAVYDLGDNSVAVLPFNNQILLSDYEWLDRGVADLLATDLSQFDTLRVVSGQRVFDIMRQLGVEGARTVPEGLQTAVAERAGVRYMLTGSIIGTADNLQIVAILSDIRTGDIRASARARGSDVFALVDEVSAAISSDLLGRTILPVEGAPVAQLTTNSLEAYREFDAGRDALWQFLSTEARGHFERAVELDSTFVMAHFQLAGLLFRGGDFVTATRHLQAASRHLETASERDRLSVGAFVDLIVGNLEEGERKFAELIERYPDEKDARIIYAGFLNGPLGRPEEVEPLLEDVLKLDPFYGEAWNMLAYSYARRGDFLGADTLIQRYVELEPGRPNPLDSRGEIFEFAGRYEDARASFRAALEVREDFAVSLGHLARTYLREGRPPEIRRAMAEFKGSESPDTRVWAWWLTADSWLWEGDVESALAAYDSLILVAAGSGRPDLHAQSLDGLVRTLILLERYERANEVAEALSAARGPDGTTSAAALHHRGSTGDFAAMERLSRAVALGVRDSGAPPSFARAAEVGGQMLIAYYRGQPEEVVRLRTDFDLTSSFPLAQYGYPGIRSAIEIEDAEAARAGVDGMMFLALAPEFHLPPLESRYREYFRARIAEIEADTADAVRRYASLIEDWGPALDQVPMFRDVRDRHAALTPEG